MEAIIESIGAGLHTTLSSVRELMLGVMPQFWMSIIFLVVSAIIVVLIQLLLEGKIKWTVVIWSIIVFLLLRFI